VWTDFWIGVGMMLAINGVLALVMILAEATIGRYGPCTITVNGDKKLTVDGGRNLLSTLKEEKIFIPSACGGRGSCGLCKVTLEGAVGEPGATELAWLSPEERKAGVRLSCQLKVKKDLAIRIPPGLLSVKQYAAVVASLRDLTYDIKELRLKLAEPAAIELRAGQFVQLEVPPYELTDEPVYRAYSVSSPPSSRGEIELEVRYVPNGICTTYVHKHLKAGDAVTLNGPYGEFYLRDSGRDVICVAGGSGMAPIKAILLDMAERKSPRKTVYFFGARARKDLFLLDEMKALEGRLPAFAFVPALSAPEPADAWTGEAGLITEVLERRLGDSREAEAYLCGNPFMIDACIKVLGKKGVPADRIYFDKFS
jgi:Na+-transporting NADH:ubiquinone oxidoreductase subunit F